MNSAMTEYRVNQPLDAADVARVFTASGIARPTHDGPRIARMLAGANLCVSAWVDRELVGVARALTDHSYCCYLSDLAVVRAFQGRGIGRGLVQHVRQQLSDEVSLILLSAPAAMDYYPRLGFVQADNAFVIRRTV